MTARGTCAPRTATTTRPATRTAASVFASRGPPDCFPFPSFLFLFLPSPFTKKSRQPCLSQTSRFQLKEFLNSQRDTRAMATQENDTHAPFSQITNADSRMHRRAGGHRFLRTCCTAATDEGGSAAARIDSESSLPVRRGPGVLLDAAHFGAGSWSCIQSIELRFVPRQPHRWMGHHNRDAFWQSRGQQL